MSTSVLRRMWKVSNTIKQQLKVASLKIILVVFFCNHDRIKTYDLLVLTDRDTQIEAMCKKKHGVVLSPGNQLLIKEFSTIPAARKLSILDYDVLAEVLLLPFFDMLINLPEVAPQ